MLWFWGLGGAFSYAFPRLLKAWKETENRTPSWWGRQLSETIGALFIGVIFAEAATPFVGHRFPWTVEPTPVALAVVIGLYANEAGPTFTRAINRWIKKQSDGA